MQKAEKVRHKGTLVLSPPHIYSQFVSDGGLGVNVFVTVAEPLKWGHVRVGEPEAIQRKVRSPRLRLDPTDGRAKRGPRSLGHPLP